MVITMSSNESSNMSFQHKQQEIEVLQQKVNAARTAVNVITIFAIFIALFMGVMLGVFNAAEPTEGMSENIHFLLGFSFIFFIIAIPSMIFNLLVKRSIAQPGLWKQALVWVYGILLLPLFPMGTAAAAVILYAQVSWMRTANT
jgi:uncharacterized membrane protein